MKDKLIIKIRDIFGLDPTKIGIRHRGFWIIDEPDPYSNYEKKGYLCVEARDGASNSPDCSVGLYPNYVGTEEDSFDRTYRYYYFKPSPEQESLIGDDAYHEKKLEEEIAKKIKKCKVIPIDPERFNLILKKTGRKKFDDNETYSDIQGKNER